MPTYSFATLDDPSANAGTVAEGINDTDLIVGGYSFAGGDHGFLLAGGMYTTLDDPSANNGTFAQGINNAGQIVGYYQNASGAHGFLRTAGIYRTFDDPSATTGETFANGINASGLIVGRYFNSIGGAEHGFLYDSNAGTFTTIDDLLGDRGTEANGINDMGQIVGAYFIGNTNHGFLYSGGQFTTIDDPLATGGTSTTVGGTILTGINDAGQIVGTYIDATGSHGFLLSGGIYTTLDDPLATAGTFTGTMPEGINNAGQIVGQYQDASGRHGFLATLGPNPPPPAGTTADMILRNGAGQYEIYDIGNNSILAAYSLGQVGTEWVFSVPSVLSGLGTFNASDTTDMMLRNRNTNGFEVYDISNNTSRARRSWARWAWSGSLSGLAAALANPTWSCAT
jgi:probable HAF family extracellular repeat protein